MSYETVPHLIRNWPSGATSFVDPVQRDAADVGRQELTLSGAIEASLDHAVYTYSPTAAELGLDPWRTVEAIDEYLDGERIDIWFVNGACRTERIADSETRFFIATRHLTAEVA